MSRSLKDLHRSLISEAMNPFPGRGPVDVRVQAAPVVPQEQWHATDEAGSRWFVKRFAFNDNVDRNRFVLDVLAFEETIGRSATLTLTDRGVHVRLQLDAGGLLPEDQAYTVHADDAYRDITLDRIGCR